MKTALPQSLIADCDCRLRLPAPIAGCEQLLVRAQTPRQAVRRSLDEPWWRCVTVRGRKTGVGGGPPASAAADGAPSGAAARRRHACTEVPLQDWVTPEGVVATACTRRTLIRVGQHFDSCCGIALQGHTTNMHDGSGTHTLHRVSATAIVCCQRSPATHNHHKKACA